MSGISSCHVVYIIFVFQIGIITGLCIVIKLTDSLAKLFLLQEDIKKLDFIQSMCLAHLLGQRLSVSQAALRNETGVKSISQIICKRKLIYWHHLTKSAENSWLRAAFSKNFKTDQGPQNPQGWNSSPLQKS